MILLLLLLCNNLVGGSVSYKRTITLEVGEIFNYSLPLQATLYYRMTSEEKALFSVQAIFQDRNKESHLYNYLSINNTRLALLSRSYALDSSLSNLTLRVVFDATVNSTQQLEVEIEYEHPTVSEPQPDPENITALIGLIVVISMAVFVGIIMFVVTYHRMNQYPTISESLESDPLISVVGNK